MIFFPCIRFVSAAPAIRVIDEQGYEIRDRYYKIGSTIDLSCQVALSFLTKNSSSTSDLSMLLPLPFGGGGSSKSMAASSSIKDNLIVDTASKAKSNSIDSFYRNIVWKKDGENVSKDALFNLRYVICNIEFNLCRKKCVNDRGSGIFSPIIFSKLIKIISILVWCSTSGGWIISRMSILSAERTHSGVYSCSVSNTTTATVDVQILNGKLSLFFEKKWIKCVYKYNMHINI